MNACVVARSVDEACAALRERPEADVLAGGTDYMVEVNAGQRRPGAIVAVNRVPELRGWHRADGHLTLGAGLTYTEMQGPELASMVPALAQAARTVGSPQIRNAGTIGGNLATASPAGDTLPVLAALDAQLTLRRGDAERVVAVHDFVTGVKRTVLEPDELLVSIRVPVLDGPQEYLKIGPRNAMVISVAGLALLVDRAGREVRCALGSVTPRLRRAREAERWVTDHVDWESGTLDDPDRTAAHFGELVADAAEPIDDHRSSAAYRRHGVGVLAARALRRAFS